MNDSVDILKRKHINLKPLYRFIAKLKHAICSGDYQNTVHYSDNTINQALDQDLIIINLLDMRAHYKAKKGHRDSALLDVQQMIEKYPHNAAGYLRKGIILSMYGQQDQAKEAYDEGLQNVAASDLSGIQNLETAKLAIAAQDERRVNFIDRLPMEIANEIIARLPLSAVVVCLTVSRLWRERTMGCAPLWTNISIGDDVTSAQLLSVMPSIGQYVHHLTIRSRSSIRDACLSQISCGHFSSLQSFKMKGRSTKGLLTHAPKILISLLVPWCTLTKVKLDFSFTYNPIKLADILHVCFFVVDLTYKSSCSMSDVVGDVSKLKEHGTLASLRLKARSITGTDIETLLQRCHQIRRLVMNGCEPSALVQVYNHAPNLEILAYNHPYPIPQLGEKVADVQGLRITAIDGGDSNDHILASIIFPLLYRNMMTLEHIFIAISPEPGYQLEQFQAPYIDFKLPKVICLILFCPFDGILKFMLQATKEAKTLLCLHLGSIHDQQGEVTHMAREFPPETTSQHLSSRNASSGSRDLVRLFNRYITLSESLHGGLKVIGLQSHPEITDNVLETLTDIKTLHQIVLCRLPNVTAKGIEHFFNKIGQQLQRVTMFDLSVITDNHIAALGKCEHLLWLNLLFLPNITDRGIHYMVSENSCMLEMLNVTGCPRITVECMEYPKEKVKSVIFNH
ncbi:hypothetical protein BJV82DRAFT_667177 [Fennellomyces sp. T-0311]|nr:hypothetical protein BJV82DRAFT_667177 [Fennellomyces sp. T-0311]